LERGNVLLSSEDGISWTQRATNIIMSFTTAITYGNGIFLVHASSGSLTSTNGIDWLQNTGGALPSLAGGNGVFVAHDYGRLLLSTDGVSWLPTLTATNNDYFYGVRFANGRFYGLGPSCLPQPMAATGLSAYQSAKAACASLPPRAAPPKRSSSATRA
jgi:hypothetical protein